MTRRYTARLALAAVTALATAACADAPQSGLTPKTPSLSAGRSPSSEQAAQRSQPLAQDITRSVTVNENKGGTIEIPEAGLRVTIPSHALPAGSGPVHVSVTAIAGSQAAYEFAPSGVQFVRPVQFEQDLAKIGAPKGSRLVPHLSYFKSEADVNAIASTVLSYEDLLTNVDLSGHTLKADIWHFSGYIVAWGFR